MATVKKLYEILHISVRSELFLIPKFGVTFKLILKINDINIKSKKLLTHKNQCNLKSRNEKKKFETNCRFDVFYKCTTHFLLLIGHFLVQPNEALSS